MHAELRDADLQSAILKRANLSGALLDGAQLQGADLSFTSLVGASLRGRIYAVPGWRAPICARATSAAPSWMPAPWSKPIGSRRGGGPGQPGLRGFT